MYAELDSPFVVMGIRTSTGFFEALPDLLPAGSVLYVEGTSIHPDIGRLYEEYGLPEPLPWIEPGTVAPKPRSFHLPVDADVMPLIGLAGEALAEPEIADHFLAYREQNVLMSWFDAWTRPLHVANVIPAERVRAFADRLGAALA